MQIERKKVADQVLEALIEMIKTGVFLPNTVLPTENELAKMFGVSRPPIREALKVLEVSGVIESRQGGRSWIKKVNLSDMMDPIKFEIVTRKQVIELLEFRKIIETNAAALAAKRRTENDMKNLDGKLAEFKQIMDDQNAIGYKEDFEFHHIIMQASKNSFIIETISNLADLHVRALEYSLSKNLGWEKKRNDVYREHERIVKAIKDQNSEAAKEAMKIHLDNAMQKLQNLKLEE
ncbi:FadR/GntR family transcriptional regulator [Rummeliibacillus pycnus]|uniref:FadR/GntR family transcriptional regulator n=1 Tax=Rummeliibacillus pycnus TaxID=101070 RepID=UPI000C9AF380|nr:FadR/GntR family transcriptional regulator [Rummeliibacillus pycnus]